MRLQPYTGQFLAKDRLTPDDQASFLSGSATVLLPPDFILWRFVSNSTDYKFGAFWIDPLTMRNIMESIHSTNTYSLKGKKERIKDDLAVLASFSNPNWRLKISLKQEVVAHVGQIAPQKRFESDKKELLLPVDKALEHRMGGYSQYVIPSFRGMPDENDYARIEHFAHI